MLTTRQASVLLRVHESSIKRWCADGELVYDTTKGGHRRIAVEDLLIFAEARSIPCSLLSFGDDALDVWDAFQSAHAKGEFESLVDMAYRWIGVGNSNQLFSLIDFCAGQGMGFARIFDSMIAPVMVIIGEKWHAGQLDIGEEHRMTALIHDALSRFRFSAPSLPQDGTDHVALVGCSEGNMHELGAQAVRLILEKRGWSVVYAGANVPAHDYAMLQVRYKAQLVCISFVPPSVLSDVQRMMDVLTRFYNPEHSYSLVLGGDTLVRKKDALGTASVFRDVQIYTSITAFESWLDNTDSFFSESASI